MIKPSGSYTLNSLIDAPLGLLLNVIRYGQRQCPAATASLWGNFPPGRVVGAAAPGLSGILRVYRLFHLGSVSSWNHRTLPILLQRKRRGLFIAVFLAGNFWVFTARDFWVAAGLVAGVADFLAGLSGAVGAGRFSVHLLLLSRGVLQGILGGPD